jgi:precorrin-6Y C5,15-methyltransferase (decarboxylating)
VFIGGGALAAGVIDAAIGALRPGGRLVVNAVTVETQSELFRRFEADGGDLISIQIARAAPVGHFHGWRTAMPVVQWTLVKA